MFCVTRAVPDTVLVVVAATETLPPFIVLVSIRVVPSIDVLAVAEAKLNENATPIFVPA